MINLKKTLTILLTAFFLLSLFPTEAQAAHDSATSISTDISDTTLSEGEYRLDADVSYTGTDNLTISDNVTLCLNGHTLTLSDGMYIDVRSNARLTICDCSAAGNGSISGSADQVIKISTAGEVTLQSGTILNIKPDGGCGVFITDDHISNHIHVNGGTIQGYKSISSGGKIFLAGSPVLVGEVDLALPYLYANSLDMTTLYTGGNITINLINSNIIPGNIIVYGTDETNAASFSLNTSLSDRFKLVPDENGDLRLRSTVTVGSHDDAVALTNASLLAASSGGLYELLPGNTYVLTEDITSNATFRFMTNGNVTLCLNGHTLSLADDKNISLTGVAVICDCGASGTQGKIIGSVYPTTGLISIGGSYSQSLTISGVTVENTHADGIGIWSSNNLLLTGGTSVPPRDTPLVNIVAVFMQVTAH